LVVGVVVESRRFGVGGVESSQKKCVVAHVPVV